ncbi:hypothetical protein IE53DRAFT_390098 [Violaceomyces palustris]|uniref:Uncharacterized protein n=1 Tax=Violaceomyces palustris TaxID=1673888 RepID=A0ACD0NPM3_9BASI|nr:hypothetical protein IE53DRAFT_390098 [Violaceomyces palustris]
MQQKQRKSSHHLQFSRDTQAAALTNQKDFVATSDPELDEVDGLADSEDDYPPPLPPPEPLGMLIQKRKANVISPTPKRRRLSSSSRQGRTCDIVNRERKPIVIPEYVPDPSLSRGEQIREEAKHKLMVQQLIKREKEAAKASQASDQSESDSDLEPLPNRNNILLATTTTSSSTARPERETGTGAPPDARPRRAAAKVNSYIFRPSLFVNADVKREEPVNALEKYITFKEKDHPLKKKKRLDIASLIKEKKSKERRGVDMESINAVDELIRKVDEERQAEERTSQIDDAEGILEGKSRLIDHGMGSTTGNNFDMSEDPSSWGSESDVPSEVFEDFQTDGDNLSEERNKIMSQRGSSTYFQSTGSVLNNEGIARALLSAAGNEESGKAALDILERDLMDRRYLSADGTCGRAANSMTFWRRGRVRRPKLAGVTPFKDSREPFLVRIAGLAQHTSRLSCFLRSGVLKFAKADRSVYSRPFLNWLLDLTIFAEETLSECALSAIKDILRVSKGDQLAEVVTILTENIPSILLRLGAKPRLIQDCFGLTHGSEFECPDIVRRDEAQVLVVGGRRVTNWLPTSDRSRSVAKVLEVTDALSGSGRLDKNATCHFLITILHISADPLSEFLIMQSERTMDTLAEGIDRSSEQERTCDRVLRMLDGRSMSERLSLLERFPSSEPRARTMRRWIAWRCLTDVANDPNTLKYSSIIPELGILSDLIKSELPSSHFYISPQAAKVQTDYVELLASSQLLSIALSDLGLQMCSSTALAPSLGASPRRRGINRQSHALETAVKPYAYLEPCRDSGRISLLRKIAETLRIVNGKIQDNKGTFLERIRAKDRLQRLFLTLEYQLNWFAARPHAADGIKNFFGPTPPATSTAKLDFAGPAHEKRSTWAVSGPQALTGPRPSSKDSSVTKKVRDIGTSRSAADDCQLKEKGPGLLASVRDSEDKLSEKGPGGTCAASEKVFGEEYRTVDSSQGHSSQGVPSKYLKRESIIRSRLPQDFDEDPCREHGTNWSHATDTKPLGPCASKTNRSSQASPWNVRVSSSNDVLAETAPDNASKSLRDGLSSKSIAPPGPSTLSCSLSPADASLPSSSSMLSRAKRTGLKLPPRTNVSDPNLRHSDNGRKETLTLQGPPSPKKRESKDDGLSQSRISRFFSPSKPSQPSTKGAGSDPDR